MEFHSAGLLEFSRNNLTQICGISRSGTLFCLEFPGVYKVKIRKIPGFFSKKVCPQTSVCFLWNTLP